MIWCLKLLFPLVFCVTINGGSATFTPRDIKQQRAWCSQKDDSRNLQLHCCSIDWLRRSRCEIRCLNSPVMIPPFKTLKHCYDFLEIKIQGIFPFFSRNTSAGEQPFYRYFWKLDRFCIPGETCTSVLGKICKTKSCTDYTYLLNVG